MKVKRENFKKWFAAIMVDLRFKLSGGTWLRTRMPIIEIGFLM